MARTAAPVQLDQLEQTLLQKILHARNTAGKNLQVRAQIECNGIHTVSVDEKTGIQALERDAPNQAMQPGKPERQECFYGRRGTTCGWQFEWGDGRDCCCDVERNSHE